MPTSSEANTQGKFEDSTLPRSPNGLDDGNKSGHDMGMWYGLEVRLTPADVGKRVVIRWRPGADDSKQMADVLGLLEFADEDSFAVRTRDGRLVVIPAGRAVAGKVVPPAPPRRRGRTDPGPT
jgi:hypothetical protein